MDEKPPFIGVVTVTYNSAQVLEDFVESLRSQVFTEFRVYAIDNASKDGSASYLDCIAVNAKPIVVVRNEENLGVAEGNNQGIELAIRDGCSYVLLVNNDTVLPTTLFSRLVSTAQGGCHQIVVPKIYRHQADGALWYAGGRFRKCLGYSAAHYGEGQIDHGQFDLPRAVEYSPTCCMLVNIQAFQTVGKMDSKYFVYYDDIDFCLRLGRAGLRIWYDPGATMFHKVGSLTGGRGSTFSARMAARNKVYFLRKNFSEFRAGITGLAYFAYTILRYLTGCDSWSLLRVKISGLREGYQMELG